MEKNWLEKNRKSGFSWGDGITIIKSKYNEGSVNLKETGNDCDFIATIKNNTDKTLKVFIDDLEGWYTDPVVIPAHDWIGFLSDDTGYFQVESIKNGDFKAILV